ncbi:MAG: IS3 family transposase [Gammaproteobacteria bacterium]|nr:IS3 family transposase [Gammaproteobacteria bacterium]
MSKQNRYSPEVKERAVRLYFEQRESYVSDWQAMEAIAPKIGCTAETLRKWVQQAERDSGLRDGLTSDDRERLKALEKENRELRRANEILKTASAFFCEGGARPQTEVMVSYIDEHKDRFGVEPICSALPIAPSTYYTRKEHERDPAKRSDRAKRDEALTPEIQRVWDENYRVYGARKIWLQLNREEIEVARCTVARLMKDLEIQGVRRGKKVITTLPGLVEERPRDAVNRDFAADRPNALWVADLTYVATWRGFVYVAFVIDAYARRIVGWRVSNSLKTDIALDALEQALYDREVQDQQLIHHSDRGVQYVSIRYSERLSEVGITASVGSVGDSYDNALAETINGLYKTELIRQQGPWRNIEEVEFATLKWVHWFNTKRLLEPIGDMPPAEKESLYYQQQEESAEAA